MKDFVDKSTENVDKNLRMSKRKRTVSTEDSGRREKIRLLGSSTTVFFSAKKEPKPKKKPQPKRKQKAKPSGKPKPQPRQKSYAKRKGKLRPKGNQKQRK